MMCLLAIICGEAISGTGMAFPPLSHNFLFLMSVVGRSGLTKLRRIKVQQNRFFNSLVLFLTPRSPNERNTKQFVHSATCSSDLLDNVFRYFYVVARSQYSSTTFLPPSDLAFSGLVIGNLGNRRRQFLERSGWFVGLPCLFAGSMWLWKIKEKPWRVTVGELGQTGGLWRTKTWLNFSITLKIIKVGFSTLGKLNYSSPTNAKSIRIYVRSFWNDQKNESSLKIKAQISSDPKPDFFQVANKCLD